MSVYFRDTAYTRATIKTYGCEQDLYETILNSEPLETASYEEFSKEYDSTNWLGRKVCAIPQMLLGGFASITMVVVATLVSIVSLLFCCDKELFHESCRGFSSAYRFLERSAGGFLQLFNDEYGSYLFQEGSFYIEANQIEHHKKPFKEHLSKRIGEIVAEGIEQVLP